jgi:hypothetical protein
MARAPARRSVPWTSNRNVAISSPLQDGVAPGTLLRDQRGIGREAGGRLRQARQQKTPICRDFSGSDGTRTRDLRRDRPSWAQRRPATNASQQAHLQVLSAPGVLRAAWLSQSSNRRLGHEWATKSCLHRQRRDVAGAARRRGEAIQIRLLLTMYSSRRPVAIHGHGSGVFPPPSRSGRLPPIATVAPAGLHRAPSFDGRVERSGRLFGAAN